MCHVFHTIWFMQLSLHWNDCRCLQSLGAFLDGKLHFLTLLQAAEAISLNSGVMYEYILTGVATNKAVAFCSIKTI